jgi:integrase
VLPASRSKNGREHVVPLSAAVLSILANVEERFGRALLFGERERPFSSFGRGFKRINRRIALAWAERAGVDKLDPMMVARFALAPWTIHDIRRTVVTTMAEIGIQPHVIEAAVNHISGHKGGVAGVYNRATYAAEKRTALERWAEWLTGIAADESSQTVVAFPQLTAAG